jgi:hypothetical protein
MTKVGLHKLELKLQKRIIGQQRYIEVVRNRALGLFADYEQSFVTNGDMAWLPEHDHIVNHPTLGSLGKRKSTNSYPGAN